MGREKLVVAGGTGPGGSVGINGGIIRGGGFGRDGGRIGGSNRKPNNGTH